MNKTQNIRRTLLRWYDAHKRNLPWRRTRDPYRIWIAEIMLQQTRVPTVVPYYQRFLHAFPTVQKLARARLGSVLRLWAGLGYYSRARHLHQAAKKIVREHGGRFPETLEEALALFGVGPYTARAILSIAYQKPVAVVDGNVARVLVRLFHLRDADPNDRATLQPMADQLVDARRPGDFNQALMELGSTVCLPRVPRCADCPLVKLCAARQAGVERTLGLRPARRVRPTTKLSVLVPRRNGRLLLVREPNGVFSGLWHFPYSELRSPARLARQLGATRPRYLETIEHEMTARNLILNVYEARLASDGATPLPGRWVPIKDIARLGVGAATRKIAAALENRG